MVKILLFFLSQSYLKKVFEDDFLRIDFAQDWANLAINHFLGHKLKKEKRTEKRKQL